VGRFDAVAIALFDVCFVGDSPTPNTLKVGDFFAGTFAVEDSSVAGSPPPTPNKLKVGDFFVSAFTVEDFSDATFDSLDVPIPNKESVGDWIAGVCLGNCAFFFINVFCLNVFFFEAVLTTIDLGGAPTPIKESVGDLDEGAVGDGFFTVVDEDTLGALEKMLRVGERSGACDCFAEADLRDPDEVLNKLRVGEGLVDGNFFGVVSFPFKLTFDDNGGEDKKENIAPPSSLFFFVDTFSAFS